jgi:metallo-beta-lactamase family protein
VVGYCTPNSLGRKIKDKEKNVKIFGELFELNADVEVIDSYSAHADYNELIRFLSCQDKTKIKKLFLVHGDLQAKISFKQKLISLGYLDVVIPNRNEPFVLN